MKSLNDLCCTVFHMPASRVCTSHVTQSLLLLAAVLEELSACESLTLLNLNGVNQLTAGALAPLATSSLKNLAIDSAVVLVPRGFDRGLARHTQLTSLACMALTVCD